MNNNFSKASFDKVCGTSFHCGYVTESAAKISEVLGDYYRVCDDKTMYEWNCTLADGTPFTIYDYKNWFAASENDVVEFHIGTKTDEDTKRVIKALKESGLNAHYSSFFN